MGKLNKLREKWGLGPIQFWLVLFTFAIGGSLSGRLCTTIMDLMILERNWLFWLIYPLFLTILWPFSVLFVSFFTGQFSFFKGYLARVGTKLMGGFSSTGAAQANAGPIHMAIFASGAGSNAKKIIEYFEANARIKVSLIVCNVPTAGVLNIAKEKGIPTLLINKAEFNASGYVESLRNANIHFIVLAGFLWKVPEMMVKAFPRSIINIHPALLPNYGGKGMYGAKVHEAVIAAGENESGITIHWVDEHYDKGDIIFQAKCKISPTDNADQLAEKIHALEHAHFAPTIEQLLIKK